MSDYTDKYEADGRLDLSALINDDFFAAIKKTWNEKHYTSCLKLLVSFIDTMAFVETGESTRGHFKQWLASYVDLHSLGISPEELWEHRNALLHMTTYDSRKVKSGQVARLVPCVGQSTPPNNESLKHYSLHSLILAVAKGVAEYIKTMTADDSMRHSFCANYEKTISDSHLTLFKGPH